MMIAGLIACLSVLTQDRDALERDLRDLEQKAAGKPDVEIYAKGVAWALGSGGAPSPKDAEILRKNLDRGLRRAGDAEQPWTKKKGRIARGYRSTIDGSIQPYGVVVPTGYDPGTPMRLDVVLHGSQVPAGMSELRFIQNFDDGDDPAAKGPGQDFIELHPLGRVENGYRYAGETDVFEAIESACRNYSIDRRRIGLRGMSMGASGTWHLGLKHPDRFTALAPYAGYVDTHQFSETPTGTFVKVGPLPDYQERTLSMLDSMDYAANAGMVPAVACMGEKDVFFQSHVIMAQAMRDEGLEMVNLISPGTGHVVDPPTHREQMRRIGEIVAKGLNEHPRHLRFVTWTLKYNRCFWIEVLALGEHYRRAEIEARLEDDGSVVVEEPRNITAFRLSPGTAVTRLRVGDAEFGRPPEGSAPITLVHREGKWVPGEVSTGKRPGLQGPIDDAFSSPFLCVRGTGTPWNDGVQKWADAALRKFAEEWRVWFRGELPVKDDAQVTPEDLRTRHLVLFGDPGSNPWIARALSRLPIEWTREELRIRGKGYAAAEHAPALIFPSPLAGAEGRYVVLNSGHTFHPSELKINYLFFPRFGDWAVLRTGPKESVADAGLFDEHWK
jgi:hypothetical protein